MPELEHRLALFVDFENLALGFTGTRKRFEIEKVLDRLLTKGKILVKKAYADWTRFGEYRRELHESSIELIEIPKRSQVGKNSADIRLCVDALDLSFSKEHITSFAICSGDSDFSPLVSKLRENGKYVIGIGMKSSTSTLLVEACDEFIYYEDMERQEAVTHVQVQPVATAGVAGDKKVEALTLFMDTVTALRRDGRETLWGSLVKDTIKRRKPQFDESWYGFKSWSDLMEEAQRRGLISLSIDTRSGTYVISSISGASPAPAANGGASAAATAAPPPSPRDWRAEIVHRREAREARERAEREAREKAAREAVEREATEKQSAERLAAARQAAEQVPSEAAAASFLSLPVAEASEAETVVMRPGEVEGDTRPHIPEEEAPAEVGAEVPGAAPSIPAPLAGVEGGNGSAEAASDAGEAEDAKKAGVRRRGRAGVRPRGGAARRGKRRAGE